MPTPLPETAQVIADVIGRAATLALAGKCQYRACYVPKTPLPDDHFIVRTIGRKKANQMQAVFGGEHLPLATCYAVHAEERNAAIRAAFRAGSTLHQIASDFGVHPDTVRRVLVPEYAERNRERTRERYHERKATLPPPPPIDTFQRGGEAGARNSAKDR